MTDEAEYDMKNSAGRGECYPPRPFKIFSSLKLVNLLAAISLFVK